MLVLMFITWMPTVAAQEGLDATGSNFRIWGSPSFDRQLGPGDEVVQVAAGDSGTVGGSALGLMSIDWGTCGDCRADLDEDGVVGASDLGLLFAEWGACP